MTDANRSRALFLDRDGVINVDHGYVHRIDQFDFVPGIFDLARFAVSCALPIVVVTNQAGIGRGLYSQAEYEALTRWMCDRFRAERAAIARVYHCPYHPELGIGIYRADHPWRKPQPGMLLQAAADLKLDLTRSFLIGDRISDIAAAAAAGIPHRVRIDPGMQPSDADAAPHRVARDLREALTLLQAFGASAAPAR
jgi:D-glycero-D-manno-heptose 1,7-bisphosphate phosphatase